MKIISKILQITGKYGWSAILLFLAVFVVGFTWSSSEDLYSNIRLFDKAALTISSSYVEQIDEGKMVKAGIDGMLAKLDPYSKFLTGADFLSLLQETDGQFTGIGVSLDFHHDTLTVESVLEGTPGYCKGLKPGDRIISIDEKSTFCKNIREIRMMLQGPRGSRVNMHVCRPGEVNFEISIERDKVDIKAVPYYGMASKGIGYIRLSRFSQGCSDEVRDALRDLLKQKMQSLILDFQDNPGGLVNEAVEIAGMFLSSGSKIVETRSRQGEVGTIYIAKREPFFLVGGLAILVNSQTASAAEIVAGAIQDHDRGVIIGSATFGKGLVQQVMQFTDDSALKLTTSKYYLPSGRCLQKRDWSTFELAASKVQEAADSLYRTDSGRPVFSGAGIIPDIYVDEDSLSPYVDAVRRGSFFFDYALNYLKNHSVKSGLKVDDATLADFEKFLQAGDFHFEDDAQVAFDQFKGKLSQSDDEMKQALDTINKKMTSKSIYEFNSHRSEIARQLEESIILQGLGEKALYSDVWIPSQPQIAQAITILGDGSRYGQILAVH
jgi:carboxyl-terminal processing protease